MAITAAKRVKTETSLSLSDSSVIHTALRALRGQGLSFSGKNCMVIGSGMMGKISAQTLMDDGARVMMTVRKYRKGVVDLPQGCQRVDYSAITTSITTRPSNCWPKPPFPMWRPARIWWRHRT